MCANDCMAFPHLQPHQYRAEKDQRCECCGHRRFDIKTSGTSTRIVPRKVMFWFGVANVIRERMFTSTSFTKHRGAGRHQYYYPSAAADRLHTDSRADKLDPNTSVYEIGLDWAQMFSSKVHSTGFIMLRCVHGPGAWFAACPLFFNCKQQQQL
eukprot:GHRQ01028178.1.p5 GENE.GHRQ01028178.1~~GHRQ01028178.1.p5  ORF type:complete len:154 (+),score=44.74 GHRQ01028178.1:1629-2090(+)